MSYRHWKVKLDDDGKFSVYGVPPGDYSFYINLFDPPEDSCLASPIASHTLNLKVAEDASVVDVGTITLIARRGIQVGDDFPNFDYLDARGMQKEFNTLGSKRKLIQIWATWCGPCIAEFPEIAEFVESHAGQNCVVFGLNVDSPDRDIAEFLQSLRFTGSKGDWHKDSHRQRCEICPQTPCPCILSSTRRAS